MPELKTLGLEGDGDDLDVLNCVESAFDIQFVEEDIRQVRNLGDLYELVVKQLGAPKPPRACFSSHVYYRLRSSLNQADYRSVKPSATLTSLTHPEDASELWRILEDDTSLEMPGLASGLAFGFSVLSVFIGIFVMAIGDFWNGLAVFVIGMASTAYFGYADSAHLPFREDATLRDLTESVVRLNFGSLAQKLGGYREVDAWRAFTEIVVEASERNVDPRSISRETAFF